MPVRLIALTGLAVLCTACSHPDLAVRIRFVPTWHGTPIDCGSDTVALSDLRFFVNDVQLIDHDGEAHDIRYATEFSWQNDAVALLDLEDGTGACQNGTSSVQDTLIGAIPKRPYKGLRFTIGVPFNLNHANPLTALPPLDDPDMHWHWRSGYKFLRAGVRTGTDGFWIHAGSAGCEGTVGNITGCRFPNRIRVELPEFVPNEHGVAIDLAMLAEGTDLLDGASSDCSSGPSEASCAAPFAALGIDFATGERTGGQHVFSAR